MTSTEYGDNAPGVYVWPHSLGTEELAFIDVVEASEKLGQPIFIPARIFEQVGTLEEPYRWERLEKIEWPSGRFFDINRDDKPQEPLVEVSIVYEATEKVMAAREAKRAADLKRWGIKEDEHDDK
jgi:hypothetical protein